MFAVVLVGGFGTRLRPLTNTVPKPMLPIGNVPMVVRLAARLAAGGVTDIVLALGFQPDAFRAAFSGDSLTHGGKTVHLHYAVEPEPRVVNMDGDMEMDGENLVNNVDELMSDTSKLKIIAKGDAKPTLKEFVTSKRKKDKVKEFNENALEQAEYLETKYGPGPEPDFDDIENFASGGIARMLGE